MIKRVEKGWGYELWIANSDLYCGKLLFFQKGKKCSYHYHQLKDETFFIHSGKLTVIWSDQHDNKDLAHQQILKEGDLFHVPPGRYHQMIAMEDTYLYEFSTQHFDSDSYRIEKGD